MKYAEAPAIASNAAEISPAVEDSATLIVSPRAFSRAAIRSACGNNWSIMARFSSCRHRLGRVWRPVQTGRRYRKDLVAGCGHSDRMLELRRQRTVLGDRGPAVAENLHFVSAGVDHRLDREEHAFAQRR